MLIYHGDPFGSEVSFWACLSDRDNLVHFMSFTEPPFIPFSLCVLCVIEKTWKKSSRQKVCHTKSRSQVVHHGDSVSPVVLLAKRASVSGKLIQIKTEKRKRPFLAASPQVARLPLLTSVPVTTCWQLTCRTWRMPPCWMSWNWLKATGEPDFSK